MKTTASGLMLVAFGLILALAVTWHPAYVNIQLIGWVLVLTGIAGMAIPKRGYGWLRRRMVVRRGPTGRPVVSGVEETRYPPYVMLNSGANNGATVVADAVADAVASDPPTVVDVPADGVGVRVMHPDAAQRAAEKTAADWQAADSAVAGWDAAEAATPPGAPPPAQAIIEEYVQE